MKIILTNNIEFILSPLDQFGSDNSLTNLMILMKCSFLRTIDIFDIADLADSSLIQAILATVSGIVFFDDDDCGDSEWEDNDINISGIQSSIFTSNIFGMIPGMETTTSDASFTFFYSIMVLTTIILIGYSLHGIRFFTILFPSGTPLIMTPFIIAIEFVSYIARVVSLGMRLFANMFAGHSLVKILMSFAWLFLTSSLSILSIPVLLLLFIIFFMEIGIAYLQSYVFGALSGMYFEDTISLGH